MRLIQAICLAGITMVAGLAEGKGGDDITGPYDVVAGWPADICGDGWQMGSTAGVWAQSADRVFVFHRGCLPELEPTRSIVPERNASRFSFAPDDPARHPRPGLHLVVFDRDGELVESWEQHNDLMVRPHRVVMDPHDPDEHVWLIDDGAHMVHKLTNDGDLIMSLGEFRVPGDDRHHFNRPTDIAFLPNGDFFVSDGYENSRVVKFDRDGRYLLEWGTPGTGKGQFDTVHGITVDGEGRVYVCDRANSRIQVFDADGNYLDEWNDITYPYYIHIGRDQHMWVSDGWTNKMLKYDLDGELLYSWGTFGKLPGAFWGPHQFSADDEGNLYIADVHVGRVQKYRPKPGADPALLVAAAAPLANAEDVIELGGFSGIGPAGLVAEHKGFFAAEGLTVRFHRVRSSKEQMRNFIDGTYDIVQTNADNIIAWAEGQGADPGTHDFVIFLGGYRGLARDLFVAPGIESFDDLRGKTLAVDAVDTGYAGVLIYMLQENGLVLNEDYSLKSVGNTALRTESMLRGETVGGFVRMTDELEHRGFKVLAQSQDYVTGYARNVAAARADWAGANRDLLVRYIRAMIRASRWLFETANRTEAISILAAAGDSSLARAEREYEAALDPEFGFIPELRIERPGIETIIRLREVMGAMTPPLPAPDKYIDESYYLEALESLSAGAPVRN